MNKTERLYIAFEKYFDVMGELGYTPKQIACYLYVKKYIDEDEYIALKDFFNKEESEDPYKKKLNLVRLRALFALKMDKWAEFIIKAIKNKYYGISKEDFDVIVDTLVQEKKEEEVIEGGHCD